LFNPGDVVVIDFPGVTGVNRRPTVVVSSAVYHASRPDVVVGLSTSRSIALGPTDYLLQDWAQAGLRVPSVFRSFFATPPPATSPQLVGHLSEGDWEGVCVCAWLWPRWLPKSRQPPRGRDLLAQTFWVTDLIQTSIPRTAGSWRR
jgi:mRNA interferase MazF